MTNAPLTREGLRAAIGLRSAVMLVVGGVIGVGIFVNPAVVARSLHAPGLALAAWGLGGAMALLGAFVYAELAARMPSTGGEYVYLRDTFGPLAGFLFGWTTLLVVHAGGMAAVSIVFAENLLRLAPGFMPERMVVLIVLASLVLVNCLGVRAGNGVQAGLGVLKVLCVAALIGAGLFITPHAPTEIGPPPPPDTLKSFGAAMIAVVFTYGGYQTANYAAGEIRNAAQTLGRALVVGMILVTILYLLLNLACLRTLGPDRLAASLTPAADVLRQAIGPSAGRLTAAAIALSALAFLSQGMLTGPRVLFAMAKDGLFFRSMAKLGETSRVPRAAIVLLGCWTAALALTGSYEQILSYDVASNFLFFCFSASCLFVLRRRDPHGASTRIPLHPWSTGTFVAACAGIVGVSLWNYPVNSLIGYAIMILGIPPFLYWRRQARTAV